MLRLFLDLLRETPTTLTTLPSTVSSKYSTPTPDHAQALLRLEDPEQQLALAEEIQEEGLSVQETRQRVRQMLRKEFRWRLVPVSLSLDIYEALQRIAPEEDVKRLIQETIQKLVQT